MKQTRVENGWTADGDYTTTPQGMAKQLRSEMDGINKVRKFFGRKPKTDYSKMIKRLH